LQPERTGPLKIVVRKPLPEELPPEATDGTTQLIIYCLLIVGASLLGGWLHTLVKLTHRRVQLMMSFVGGLMLGIAIFQMLPDALHQLGPQRTDVATACMMAGMLTMFFLLRAFHFHHHDPGEVIEHTELSTAGKHSHDHDHDCGGDAHAHGEPGATALPHELSWLGVFLGLGLHTLIDGIALAASVQNDGAKGMIGLLGIGTFLAILVHKPLDAVSITALMSHSQWSTSRRLLVVGTFSIMCPLGVLLYVTGLGHFSANEELFVGGALAFSAGVFLCISLSDLLPEMEFHSHHRVQLTVALLAGIALAWGLHSLEPSHRHDTPPAPEVQLSPATR